MSYPYLLAQMPTLRFNSNEFPTSCYFLEQASKWLTEEELLNLESADINDYSAKGHSMELLTVLTEWSEHENKLRRDIANYRESHRLGHDHKTHMFPTSYLKDSTPLQAEIKILQLRWDFLSEKEHVHYDDLHALIIYILKLQILERKNCFDFDKGHECFEKLTDIESIWENINGEQAEIN